MSPVSNPQILPGTPPSREESKRYGILAIVAIVVAIGLVVWWWNMPQTPSIVTPVSRPQDKNSAMIQSMTAGTKSSFSKEQEQAILKSMSAGRN